MRIWDYTCYNIHYVKLGFYSYDVYQVAPIKLEYREIVSCNPKIDRCLLYEVVVPWNKRLRTGDIVLIEKRFLPIAHEIWQKLLPAVPDLWVVLGVERDNEGKVFVRRNQLYRVP